MYPSTSSANLHDMSANSSLNFINSNSWDLWKSHAYWCHDHNCCCSWLWKLLTSCSFNTPWGPPTSWNVHFYWNDLNFINDYLMTRYTSWINIHAVSIAILIYRVYAQHLLTMLPLILYKINMSMISANISRHLLAVRSHYNMVTQSTFCMTNMENGRP